MRQRGAKQICGGGLLNTREGTLFLGYDGSRRLFRGVRVHLSRFLPFTPAAFQLCGHIFVNRRWARKSFGVRVFAHEYGHYLQQKQMGFLRYFFRVAVPSAWSVLRNPRRHALKWFEQQATEWGRAYLEQRRRP